MDRGREPPHLASRAAIAQASTGKGGALREEPWPHCGRGADSGRVSSEGGPPSRVERPSTAAQGRRLDRSERRQHRAGPRRGSVGSRVSSSGLSRTERVNAVIADVLRCFVDDR
jgi:hypothetical protein